MLPCISVIICTHNPRHDYLDKVLEALRVQTLSSELWELLLIDNASEKPINLEINLDWHPQARHIREEELGLTPARLRGIKEARAELLVFVDDDNVLDSEYLEVTLQISKSWSMLGVWGGQTPPKFDAPPPDWTKPYWYMLAIYQFDLDRWSNVLYAGTNPCGAGMCVRKIVAKKYADLVCNDPKRMNMDRKGKSLVSCGDTDLAFTACDLNLGMGQFASLKLTHLIPTERLQESYLLRLAQANGYSSVILRSFRDDTLSFSKQSWRGKLIEYYYTQRMEQRERRFYQAKKRGEMSAIQDLSNS